MNENFDKKILKKNSGRGSSTKLFNNTSLIKLSESSKDINRKLLFQYSLCFINGRFIKIFCLKGYHALIVFSRNKCIPYFHDSLIQFKARDHILYVLKSRLFPVHWSNVHF